MLLLHLYNYVYVIKYVQTISSVSRLQLISDIQIFENYWKCHINDDCSRHAKAR